ncbi:DNA helicase [Paenibacillus baekrokdamisoli]|uniref:DNA 3'-5' helicase n=1 Tax=Paenibacillus baekrokdamisoli TaxID=1712516 RepID=A0A3G9J5C1_9BACL|nr:3'-5' exonuclease [Paenibacillus baekrokdamisoli]MBB3070622.1 DNA helicase-2/ATP-dependent DNA helicase PcrA [Paenibacillus baekrokdamisoli]BBH19973.1 DNA helicase [Paenibacillus baekrokdamisoli]
MTVQSAFQDEAERVEIVLRHIRNQLRAIGPRYTGDDFTEQMLQLQREERQQRLEVSEKEPYFGRIDFQEPSQQEPKPLYIGKAGVAHEKTTELLVIDWRAPVASLFYAFSGGEAPVSYESPDGDIEGTVHLKRNLMVREGKLERLVDSYVRGQEEESVTDEFLLYRLGESKDNKLRDIVSTIQQEQDRIIRTEKNKAVFIQGVAGSGKTTVALHRLAYLLYRYAGSIRAERMVIFAPNRMFLDYISGVLPELGVGDIVQTTYTEWALDQLQQTVRLDEATDTMDYWFEQPRTREEIEQAPGRLKGSLAFKRAVDEKLAQTEETLLPQQSFEPIEGMVLKPAAIAEWIATDDYGEPFMKRRNRLVSRIKRWLESEWKTRRLTDSKLKTKANAKLNAYCKKIPSYTAPQLYSLLLNDAAAVPMLSAQARTTSIKALKQSKVQPEDLAPLVYIQLRLFGFDNPTFDHVVIDEAQDYSPFQLEALKLCQRQASMTVLGDLQQGIHGYAGIHSWGELTALFPADHTGYFELDRSYRSTMEIIDFANRVLGGMGDGVKPATPVFRSGEAVDVEQAINDGVRLDEIVQTVKNWRNEESYRTIAVLGRTARSCEAIATRLEAEGIQVSLVQSKQEAYKGGLTVVPAYLAKGLEFDAVLIADADQTSFGPNDAKLLYVACTRALHKLKLLYCGALTNLVEEAVAQS